jgi:hypothetical protein
LLMNPKVVAATRRFLWHLKRCRFGCLVAAWGLRLLAALLLVVLYAWITADVNAGWLELGMLVLVGAGIGTCAGKTRNSGLLYGAVAGVLMFVLVDLVSSLGSMLCSGLGLALLATAGLGALSARKEGSTRDKS